MAWFRLDDQGAFHEKVLAAGNEAYGAWCRAGQWSSLHGTEGRIPRAVALSIGPMKLWKRLADARGQSNHGLVEPAGDDYLMHDFLVYNPTAEEVATKRHARSEAGRRGAAARWGGQPDDSKRHGKPDGNRMAKAMAPSMAKRCPDPDPDPDPDPKMVDHQPTDRELLGSARRSDPLVALGTAGCEEACRRFVEYLAEAGWNRGVIRERWERQALADAVSVHMDVDGTIGGAFERLRALVAEWADGATPQYTAGWSARKFAEWLATRRVEARQHKLPPLSPEPEGEPLSAEEQAELDAVLEAAERVHAVGAAT